MDRLKAHLIRNGDWSEEQHGKLTAELNRLLDDAWEEAVSYGTMTEGPFLDKNEMFEDVFKDMPAFLIRQREQLRALED